MATLAASMAKSWFLGLCVIIPRPSAPKDWGGGGDCCMVVGLLLVAALVEGGLVRAGTFPTSLPRMNGHSP